MNSEDPKRHQCVSFNDTNWHDFTVKVDTKGLSNDIHIITLYAIQGSKEYRSNLIRHRFAISNFGNLNLGTCDNNYNHKINDASLIPSLLIGGLSSYFEF